LNAASNIAFDMGVIFDLGVILKRIQNYKINEDFSKNQAISFVCQFLSRNCSQIDMINYNTRKFRKGT
jgi:hypothetical protein